MPKTTAAILLLLTGYFHCQAQDSNEENFTGAAINNAITLYYQFTEKQARLYNGLEYYDYSPKLQGHAYFMDSSWKTGSIIYDGITYRDVSMMYDLVRDEVVILHFNNIKKMGLLSEKVKEFTLQGHHFLRIEKDSLSKSPLTTGFYDKLYEDRSAVLARRIKIIEEKVTNEVEQYITVHDHYYIRKEGVYHEVSTYKGLLDIFKTDAKEIRQYLRKNKIRYRKNRENAIMKAVAYYDSIKK